MSQVSLPCSAVWALVYVPDELPEHVGADAAVAPKALKTKTTSPAAGDDARPPVSVPDRLIVYDAPVPFPLVTPTSWMGMAVLSQTLLLVIA